MIRRLAVFGSAGLMALVFSVGWFASPAAADAITDAANKKIVAGKYAEAKSNIKMIEDIYTSMGRPIPQ